MLSLFKQLRPGTSGCCLCEAGLSTRTGGRGGKLGFYSNWTYTRSVGHEVPDVVAVPYDCMSGYWVTLVVYLVGNLVSYCKLPASKPLDL